MINSTNSRVKCRSSRQSSLRAIEIVFSYVTLPCRPLNNYKFEFTNWMTSYYMPIDVTHAKKLLALLCNAKLGTS